MSDDPSRIGFKKAGDKFQSIDYNKLALAILRLMNIKGDKDHNIQQAGLGYIVGHKAGLSFGMGVPAICTAEDTPSAGLHTFTECDVDGVAVSGGQVFTSCRLLGDFDDDWDVFDCKWQRNIWIGIYIQEHKLCVDSFECGECVLL